APTGTIAGIWETSYNSIANANNILKHIDEAQGIFTGDNYAIIKGETLGLRAFLHFDLLRCFGVSWAVNPDQPAIPYVTEFTYRVFPQLTVRQVIEKIQDDLTEAEKLLAVDPILTGRTITELDDAGYLMNRTVHFNYYAVKALQARVAMWIGDYPAAALAAQEVMDSEQFSWAAQELMSNGTDPTLVDEQVFALNNVNLSTLADTYFNDERNTTSFSITRTSQFSIFENETTDLRYLFLFFSGETGETVDNRYCTKFTQSSSSDMWYQSKMPMIRIGELQLILAECAWRENGTGLAEINTLREVRNVPALENEPENFLDYLIREYRRELIGEGQLFFLLKRLDRQYIPGADIDARDSKAYTFPL
ncbi:MAG: RagB/SusD family nutrient uptake outer membrane protein, partial [Duncaniella sp.]|nr:RagB/SusD family nutrient uptake outer membrane protein [Duncaniella sp.]